MYIKRHIEQAVLDRAKMKGAVVVTGARQAGKTTLIETLKPDIPKITFDDLPIRQRAVSEPSTFFDFYPPPVFIDEVQYAPVIFHYIKILLDKSRNKGDFFLTGSQSFELMENVTESLAGRAGILSLHGLSLREINGESWDKPFRSTMEYLMERKANKTVMNTLSIWETIHRGCLPELVANSEMKWQQFYTDYIITYLERDVRKLTQVADEDSFYKFMTVCAATTGQMLNLSSLAKDVGISEPTAKRWLSILKTSGLVYLLKPYSNNAISRAVKTPKLHFLDIGLAA
jgi:predicted AAA+ superfamily ATPase